MTNPIYLTKKQIFKWKDSIPEYKVPLWVLQFIELLYFVTLIWGLWIIADFVTSIDWILWNILTGLYALLFFPLFLLLFPKWNIIDHIFGTSCYKKRKIYESRRYSMPTKVERMYNLEKSYLSLEDQKLVIISDDSVEIAGVNLKNRSWEVFISSDEYIVPGNTPWNMSDELMDPDQIKEIPTVEDWNNVLNYIWWTLDQKNYFFEKVLWFISPVIATSTLWKKGGYYQLYITNEIIGFQESIWGSIEVVFKA